MVLEFWPARRLFAPSLIAAITALLRTVTCPQTAEVDASSATASVKVIGK